MNIVRRAFFAMIFATMATVCAPLGPDDASTAFSASKPEAPVPGMVTMVDLGAKSCIPCKMMAPILTELEAEYKGRAAIVFIDVWEDNTQAARFGIKSIPTQIFYDRTGKEVYRHVGFLEKKLIQERIDALLKG